MYSKIEWKSIILFNFHIAKPKEYFKGITYVNALASIERLVYVVLLAYYQRTTFYLSEFGNFSVNDVSGR
jgi:hypothetical protein